MSTNTPARGALPATVVVNPGETPRVVTAETKEGFVRQRLGSLDAYRGLIMISLAFNGFGLAAAAGNYLEKNPQSQAWQTVYHHFEHVEWTGCGYWDLIQPSFMFMVGVSMAYSYVRRQRLGQSYTRMLLHAMTRSLLLILLGIFLISNSGPPQNWSGGPWTNWSLVNVLTQIGLGYTFLFLMWGRGFRLQALAAVAVLVATWLAFELYPHSGIDIDKGAEEVGVSREWAQDHLRGLRPAWHKNANIGHAIDRWLLNVFPREDEFVFNSGGYQTFNFLPSLATMIFGLMCGALLRTELKPIYKFLILAAAGGLGLAAGLLLHASGICPLVKRIWTPSWALFSTGWCCLFLAFFYAVIDLIGWRRWAFPLVVVGMNSLAIYCMSMTLKGWTANAFKTHFGGGVFEIFGADPAPIVQATAVGLVFWLICWWMYRQRVFVRL
jgi:predicted acyltransferase